MLLADKAEIIRSLRRADGMSAELEKELQAIIRQGYAVDLEEAECGLHCLALPLRQHGKIVAALGISGPSQRLSTERISHLVTQLMRWKV